jgi:hypothetical protein
MKVAEFLQKVSFEGRPMNNRAIEVLNNSSQKDFEQLIEEVQQLQTGARQQIVINIDNMMDDMSWIVLRRDYEADTELEKALVRILENANKQQ